MQNKVRNNKGFSMVELLAAVAILGLLSALAIVGVGAVLDQAEENHYETQKDNMILAAQSYAQDNRNVLPKEIGDTRVITLRELQNAKYIGEVVDRSKTACEEGTVTIFKYSKDGYSYSTYLKCPSKTIGDDSGIIAGPNVTLKASNSYNAPYFTYKIGPNDENDGKIISYSYQIYKNSVLVNDSGSIAVSNAASIDEKKVSLKEYVPGDFKIVFKSTNHYGGTTTKTIEKGYQDPDGPECGTINPDRNAWENTNEVTVSITCIDNSGSGCAREIFSQQFTGESENGTIEIVNNLGNKTACPVGVFIDKTAPDKPIINSPYKNEWTNTSYAVEVISTDNTSGIAYYQYRYPNSAVASEREWVTYEKSRRTGDKLVPGEYKYTTTEFSKERNEYVEIRACDQAGNCSEPSESMIKIDKTAPNVPTLNNPYLNQWPLITDVNANKYVINVTSSDSGSGISKYQYRYPNSSTNWNDYAASAGNTFTTPPFKTGRNEDVEIRACDTTGNCSLGALSKIMIDATAPKCSIAKTGTGSGNSYTSVVTLTLTTSDSDGSGVKDYGLVAGNNAVNYNGISSNTQSQTSGITWYGFVRDAVGNVGSCNSGNFKVTLRTIPEFTYTGTYELVDDDDNPIADPNTWTGNWKIRFLTSGTFTITKLHGAANGIDVFLVGGGGNGGSTYSAQAGRFGYSSGGGGGGGGYRKTQKGVSVSTKSYSITIGAAKTKSTAFGYTADPGANGSGGSADLSICEGGPAGGKGGSAGGRGGINACDPYNGGTGGCEFNDCNFSSRRYGGGGGGGHGHNGGMYIGQPQSTGVGQPGSGGSGGGGTGNNQYRGYNTHNGQANTGGGGGGASFVFDDWDACNFSSNSSCNCWSVDGCFKISTTKQYSAGTGGSGIVIIRNKR